MDGLFKITLLSCTAAFDVFLEDLFWKGRPRVCTNAKTHMGKKLKFSIKRVGRRNNIQLVSSVLIPHTILFSH